MQLLKRLLLLARNTLKTISLLLACILINYAFASNHAFADNTSIATDIIIPGATASMPGIPAYSFVNPVFADIHEAFSLQYRFAHINQTDTGMHYVATTLYGLTIAYSTIEALAGKDAFTKTDGHSWYFGKGIMINDWFGVGISHRRYTVNDNHVNAWGYGLLMQPSRFLSLGIAVDHADTPRMGEVKLKQREWYSAGIRPFGNSLTLGWDIIRHAGQQWGDVLHMVTLSGIMWRDILYSVQYDTQKNLSFGLAVPIDISTRRGATAIYDAGYVNYNEQGTYAYTLGVTLTAQRFRNAMSSRKRYLAVVLREPVEEVSEGGVFQAPRPSFYEVSRSLREATYDQNIAGIIIHIDGPAVTFAQAQELREEIKRSREKGKPVFCILSSMGNVEYYLASAASKIYFAPNQPFGITGLKADVYFFRGLLDKIGVRFEEVKRGEYKSFGESFTQRQMSEAVRENVISMLKDLNRQFIADIAEGRNLTVQEVEHAMDSGMLTPEQAKLKGLVDVIAHPLDVMHKIGHGRYGLSSVVQCENYIEEKMYVYDWGRKPRIAVVFVDGNIIRGESRGNEFFSPAMIGDVNYQKYLERVFSDRSVEAVVIRINSGGGSAIASDLMWHALIAMKKRHKKPVVISFGSIAASGGYYIASTNDTIFTNKATITGSIGVVFGKLNLEELYNKLGINKETIKMSEFADLFTESRGFTEKERQLVQRSVEFTYNQFIQKVAAGRNIAFENIPSIAEGRVFSGNQALGNGLADKEGGLISAISFAASRAGIQGEFEVVEFPDNNVDIRKMLRGTSFQSALTGMMRYLYNTVIFESLNNEEVLLLFPYEIVIR